MSERLIGDIVKDLRKDKGWTQHKLAEKAGLNPNVVSYIENNQHVPRYEYIEYLLEAMGYELKIVRTKE